ncbi:Clavaminate synthase-like protein [Sistotremastrum niveocremeum HHB9708]|uniref:Clavaminate synthase-like protein n=1 Tax=Sistotremastrum niveocremeum HHB9708 TaxID=1314777 RepID=A0A164TCB1_9AGAM|nr:Clavaminate synthase-like protein [Sistotremastrum niveocremeum HHB9708]
MAAFHTIPVIDYSLSQGPQKQLFLSQLRHAIINVGFLQLKNSTVPSSLIARVKARAPEFFDLPQSKKDQINIANSPHFMGYSGFATEVTKGKADQREQFDLCISPPCQYREGDPIYKKLWGPAQWPDEADLPGFRDLMTEYYGELLKLSANFMRLLCESLGLPPNAFDPFLGDPSQISHRGKIAKYHAIAPGSSNQGVGAHYDPDFLNILLQVTDQGGLQAQNHKGEWIPVPPLKDTFVINIGRGLEAVTKNVALATSHRALSPPKGTGPRYSMPFSQGLRQEIKLSDYDLDFPREILALRDTRNDGRADPASYYEFETECGGMANLVGRVKSHPEVAVRHYPELFAKYFPDGMPAKGSSPY